MENKEITHEVVQEATNEFLKAGGLVMRLPDQVVKPSRLVAFKYATKEKLFMDEKGFSEKEIVYN